MTVTAGFALALGMAIGWFSCSLFNAAHWLRALRRFEAELADARHMAMLRRADVASGSAQCRVCGCTQGIACLGGCSWVERDLCSRCA